MRPNVTAIAREQRPRGPTVDQLAEAAALLYVNELRDEEIAARLGVCRRTLARWKHRPAFQAAYAVEVERGSRRVLATAAQAAERWWQSVQGRRR